MLNIKLQSVENRKVSFYLAMEEYIAKQEFAGDAFFIWQVSPSVIFGRNQLIANEVNILYCRDNGISMFRRKSGGGCVYADWGNMMLSYITKSDQVMFTYHKYTTLVVNALKRIGIAAATNGRNDILVDGQKVSGNAFYHLPRHNIVHGTMLYDTDVQHMQSCLTPAAEKLNNHGVQSVRQRITLLKDYTQRSMPEIKESLTSFICDSSISLSDDDICRIEELEKEYLDPDFIFGKNPRHTITKSRYIEGVGRVEAHLELKNNIIKDIDFKGDFFVLGEIDYLRKLLIGKPLQAEVLATLIPEDIGNTIMNIKKTDVISLLIESSIDN